MRVALLARDSTVAQWLSREIAAGFDLVLIVSESGSDARKRKLKRELSRGFPLRLPLAVLDLFALAVYGKRWTEYAARRDAEGGRAGTWAGGVELVSVDDANDVGATAALRDAQPDVVLVLGTAILRGEILTVAKQHMLNVHGGIVSEYRNVHSEVWAVLNEDLGNVGVSILHLDEGIDSGAVALQERLEPQPGESFFSLRYRNNELAVRTALKALKLAADGALSSTPQDTDRKGFYPTPGVGPLFTLWRKTRDGLAS